jgi:16S rRNA (cytosine1402-N4)-methyltransferase
MGGRHLAISHATVRAGAPKGTAQAPGTHTPAMLAECVESLISDPDGVYVDATFGRGGHTRGLLAQLSPRGRLHAFDLDPVAIAAGKQLEREDRRFRIHHAPFGSMAQILKDEGPIGGVLLDLGISSPQLDEAARGFKPEQNGPLDLRFDLTKGVPAWQFLQTVPREELVRILRTYGEEDKVAARRIADAIVLAREAGTLPTRTKELGDLIVRVKGREYQPMHPAKPTFQALRIHLNDEFDELRRGMAACLEILCVDGRIGILTWKHLECAIVVDFFRLHELARNELPLMQWCRAAQPNALRALEQAEDALVMDEPRRPTQAELAYNSRSRSAVLHLLRKQKGIRVPRLEGIAYEALDWEEL